MMRDIFLYSRPLRLLLSALLVVLAASANSAGGFAQSTTENQAGATSLVEGIRRYEAGDYAGAMEQWRPLAEIGNADALFNLGQLYRLGQGVPVDTALAESLYIQAADAGHVTAKANLATIYYFNHGSRERRGQAIRLWRDAASHGDARSQYMMAVLHFNGDEVPQDPVQAYAWLLLSIERGLNDARAAEPTIRPALTENELAQARLLMSELLASAPPPPPMTAIAVVPEERPVSGTDAAPDLQSDPEPVAEPEPEPAPEPVPQQPAPVQEVAPVAGPPAATIPQRTPGPDNFRSLAGRWSVQLGFFREEANARSQRTSVEQQAGQIVAGLWWDLTETEPRADGSTFHKLLIGPFSGRAAADSICGALKAEGFDCFVVAP